MSRYRMLHKITGTHDGLDWPDAGGIVELTGDEEANMVTAGLVVAVEDGDDEVDEMDQADAEELETAVDPAPEVTAPEAPEVTGLPAVEKATQKRTGAFK